MSEGTCDAAFTGVRDVLDAHLADGTDLGASVAVVVGGRPVVDVWGGVADAKAGRPWERDTRCVTFSCTKAVTATAALLLAERGEVDLAASVTDWWPEFGTHGKESTTGADLLTHRAGLPAFDRPVGVEEAADPAAMAAQLAGQAPEWEPGTAHGYHAITFGWLAGELVRRVGGRPVGEFVRAEIDPDLHVGVAESELSGLARIAAGRPMRVDPPAAPRERIAALVDATQGPASRFLRSTGNPAASFNNPALLTAGWPAAGIVATAREFVAFYARLAAGEILRPETLREATRVHVSGPDATLVLDSAFGLGFMLPCPNMFLPPAARDSAFGHPGASGALGLADVERQVAVAYIPNLSRPGSGDRRAHAIVEAVYAAL